MDESVNTSVSAVSQESTTTPPVGPTQTPPQENAGDKPKVKQPSKKKLIIGFLLGLLLIVVLLVVSVANVFNSKTPTKISVNTTSSPNIKTMGASLGFFEGEVEYQRGESGWKTPPVDLALKVGDKVRVLSSGRAVVNFDDGSIVRVNSNSTIKIISLNVNSIELANEKGEVYSRVVKSDRNFMVMAGEVKYQSLGTSYTTANTDEEKGVEVYESSVKVTEGNKETVVKQGNKYSPEKKKVEAIVLPELKKDKFVIWNKQEDEKISEFKQDLGVLEDIDITPTPKPVNAGYGLYLFASKTDSGIKFTWEKKIENIYIPSGFKLLKSESINPVYPGNEFQYISDSSAREYAWNIKDGKTYHFRVCTYVDGKCGVYSNDVVQTAPSGESLGKVNSITLKSEGGNNVSWNVDGYSKLGYKIVFSKNPDPTYPNRDGDKYIYLSNPDEKNTSIDAFSGSGKYYVRVCEYLGGNCGTYSNQIEVNL